MKNPIIILSVLSVIAIGCQSGQINIIEIQPEELTQMPFAVCQPLNHMTYCGSDSLYHYFFHSKLKGGGNYKASRENLFFADEFSHKEYRKNGGYKVVLFSVHFDKEKNMWQGYLIKDITSLPEDENTKIGNTIAAQCGDTVYVTQHRTETYELYTLYYSNGDILEKIYEIRTEDESSLSLMYAHNSHRENYMCFILNNNSADCNRFIFYNAKNKNFYITTACFSGFYPQKDEVNFENRTLTLFNEYAKGNESIEIDEMISHVPYTDTIKTIKSAIQLINQ
jgi:hypothetical protein